VIGIGQEMKIGGFGTSNQSHPTVDHATFVAKAVLPTLSGACERFGQESVARSIVALARPLYENTEPDKYNDVVPCFLSATLCGGSEIGNISRNVTNPLLAEKYGVDYVFGPIVKLGLVHHETRVFDSVGKFLRHHACRMGEVIDGFCEQDYHDYIDQCATLLRHGIYDWSLEHNPEEWGILRPSIRLYGLRAVLSPIVQMMIDIGHLPGTKHCKYKYSYFHQVFRDLLPLLSPRVRKIGPEEIDRLLRPITDFILELSKYGPFCHEVSPFVCPTTEFFRSFAGLIGEIEEVGIKQVIDKNRSRWMKSMT